MLNQEAKVPFGIVEMSCQKELKAEVDSGKQEEVK